MFGTRRVQKALVKAFYRGGTKKDLRKRRREERKKKRATRPNPWWHSILRWKLGK